MIHFRKVSFIVGSRKASKASLGSQKISGAGLNVRKPSTLIPPSPITSRGDTLASCGSYNNKDESEVSQCSMLVQTSVAQ